MKIKEMIGDIISSEERVNSVDVQEGYNLWEGLRTRYDAIEKIQIYENFIHDLDFEIVTEGILFDLFENQINKLEAELDKYKLTLPNRPPKSVRAPANTEVITDRFMATEILGLLQTELDLHIRSVFVK